MEPGDDWANASLHYMPLACIANQKLPEVSPYSSEKRGGEPIPPYTDLTRPLLCFSVDHP
jgi:hypothetical protein